MSNIIDSIEIICDKINSEKFTNITNNKLEEYTSYLISIYQTLESESDKDTFLNTLLKMIQNWKNSSFMSFVTLLKLGKVEIGIKSMRHNSISHYFLQEIEKYSDYFSSKDLWWILKIMEGRYFEHNTSANRKKQEICDRIKELRYNKLTAQLNYHTIEIDNDKKEVEKLLKEFWFDTKYNASLNKVDEYFWDEEWDDTVIPWWIIWVYRQFFDDFYMDIALKLAEINWLENIPEDISPKKTSKFWHALAYISREFWISEDEEHLLKWHYWVTNREWAHKLLSNKKYFRLVKNISIEIALFMLTKLDDYSNGK